MKNVPAFLLFCLLCFSATAQNENGIEELRQIVIGKSQLVSVVETEGEFPIVVVNFKNEGDKINQIAFFDNAKSQIASRISYKEDVSFQEDFYESGQVKRVLYKKGDKITEERLYYESGQLFKAWQPQNEKNQKVETFHENGKLKSQCTYNAIDGICGKNVLWHDNGAIQSESYFVKGKQNGDLREYDRNSKLTKIQTFKDGKKLGS